MVGSIEQHTVNSTLLALKKIHQEVRLIPKEDSAKFTEAVETELLSLCGGNIARYKIRFSDFEKWKKVWYRS